MKLRAATLQDMGTPGKVMFSLKSEFFTVIDTGPLTGLFVKGDTIRAREADGSLELTPLEANLFLWTVVTHTKSPLVETEVPGVGMVLFFFYHINNRLCSVPARVYEQGKLFWVRDA